MSFPASFQHTGSLNGSPSNSGSAVPSLQEILCTTFQATYSGRKSGAPTIVGATDGAPFVLNFETLTKVRLFGVRISGGSLKIKMTSAGGTLQSVMCSDLFLLHSPNTGDEITAINLVGTANIEYLIAGDVS